MPVLSMRARVLICLVVSALLIAATMSLASAEPTIPIPGTNIDVGDLLPSGDNGLPGVVENLTNTLTGGPAALPNIPVVPQVTNTVANLVTNVQDLAGNLPAPQLPNLVGNSPLQTQSLNPGALSSGAPGTRQLTGALTSLPAGADALGSLSASSLPGADQLMAILDPANLPSLESLPLIGTLLNLLDPANLPSLEELPVIGTVLPTITCLLEKVKEIPVISPILTPIIEIIEKIIGKLIPPADVEPVTPSGPEPSSNVPGVVSAVAPASPVSGSLEGELPYTGADFRGILFLIFILLCSTLLVRRVEVKLKEGRAR